MRLTVSRIAGEASIVLHARARGSRAAAFKGRIDCYIGNETGRPQMVHIAGIRKTIARFPAAAIKTHRCFFSWAGNRAFTRELGGKWA